MCLFCYMYHVKTLVLPSRIYLYNCHNHVFLTICSIHLNWPNKQCSNSSSRNYLVGSQLKSNTITETNKHATSKFIRSDDKLSYWICYMSNGRKGLKCGISVMFIMTYCHVLMRHIDKSTWIICYRDDWRYIQLSISKVTQIHCHDKLAPRL